MCSNTTIIFCTCDVYADLWDGFFKLFKKYWPDFDGEIILNTESQAYQYEGLNISAPLNCGKDVSWSDRLAMSLDRASGEYVLIMLEDFYFNAPVDHLEFQRTVEYMRQNRKAASITYLREPGGTGKEDPTFPGFQLRKQFSLYKMTAHITLYRKSYLRDLLRRNENAWQFEVNGTIRSWFKTGTAFCPLSCQSLIFPYDWGTLVIRGKYYKPTKEHFLHHEQCVFDENRATTDQLITPEKPAGFVKKLRYLVTGLLSIFKTRP